jgi:hypothetical protein
MKLLRSTAITAALMTATVPSLTSPAQAAWWGWRGGGWGWGGLGAGLAAGALIGGAIAASNYGYGYPAYSYGGYGYPAYGYGTGYGYAPAYMVPVTATPRLMALAIALVTAIPLTRRTELSNIPLQDGVSMPLLPVSIIIVIRTNP